MTNPIVSVTISLQIPPAPSTLQRTGALVSQGGTNTSPGTKTLLTQLSNLTPFLRGAAALTSISTSGTTATATTTAPHGYPIGDIVELTMAGVLISGSSSPYLNGTFPCTITGASTFTYVTASSSSAATTPGAYTPEDVAELLAMATTFFAQGTAASIYALELGPTAPTDGVAFLAAWIALNPNTFYAYLVPRPWDGNAAFLSFIASYEAPTAKTYFFVTTTLATYNNYTSGLLKCINALVESPAYGVWPANALTAISYSGGLVTATTTTAHGVVVGQWFQIAGVTPSGYNGWWQALQGTTGSTLVYGVPANPGSETVLGTLVLSYYSNPGIPALEFSHAATFYDTISTNLSSVNKLQPLNQRYTYGVTPFPTQGNSAVLSQLATANVSVIGTGAAGGISATVLVGGNTMDGNQWQYWYAIDWAQINFALSLNNAVINGANNPVNPLVLNQDGINSLQATAAATAGQGVSYGCLLGSVIQTELDATPFDAALAAGTYAGNVVINAVPFVNYYSSTESPNDYAIGRYAGFTCVLQPQLGFSTIVFSIIATLLAAP